MSKNCDWCGNEIEGTPITAYEKRDGCCIELSREPIKGGKRLALCKSCAEDA